VNIGKIRFRISGGFAGLVRGTDLTTEELTAEERRALDRHLAHGEVARADHARDLLQYEFEAETDSGTRRIAFDEMSTPGDLADLVTRLAQRAKPVRP
jgi:hypothetical protein